MKNPRIHKAFNAMKALGIDRDAAKPALKHLIKLFDGNWEFIEAENYRALVDAIFDCKEDKEVGVKRKKKVDSDCLQPPLKKLQVKPEDDEASSTVDSTEILVVSKEGDISQTSFSSGRPNTSNSNVVKIKTEPGCCSSMDKGKGLISLDMESTSEKLTPIRETSSSCSKLPVDESNCVLSDKEKNPAYHDNNKLTSLDFIGSTSKIHSDLPDLVEGSSIGNISTKSSQWVDLENTKDYCSTRNFRRGECKFDIASLPSGHVKLCCVSSLGQTTSHTPDIAAVLKSAEEKFLRSQNLVGSSFSLTKLLQDLCESIFEFSTGYMDRPLVRSSSPEVIGHEVSNEKKSENESSQVMRDEPCLYIDDITKGEENVKISLVDEQGNRHPPKFFYIPRNIIYQKAIVNISLARISDEDCCPSCSGDCLSSPVPCACARITNGEFAYTPDGLLKEEFLSACISENRYVYCQDCPIERAKNERKPKKCKGHSVRRFIKECWSKCGCNMQCGNRVVQRGIACKLQVFWTNEGKGWGLRTMEDLPKGAFVCEYVGEVVTNTELDERNNQSRGNKRHTYPVQLDADWSSESILSDDFALCLDATNYGNVARFVNHRCCDANLFEIPVEVETVDHHYYHVAFFTTKEVKAFEELNWDYGLDFDDEYHPIKAFKCLCGSEFCRDKNRKGSRSKPRASVVR